MSKDRQSTFLGMTPKVVFQHPRSHLSKEKLYGSLLSSASTGICVLGQLMVGLM